MIRTLTAAALAALLLAGCARPLMPVETNAQVPPPNKPETVKNRTQPGPAPAGATEGAR